MVVDDTQLIDRLPLLTDTERHQLLYEWNDTAVEFPGDKCVHELFEEQVAKTPEAVAVVYEDAEMSYAELNRRANQLAHHLGELGVKPDDRVAICVERGFEMIVGLLAVLKAGGAYVPLDPAYPIDRLRFMLEDSAPVMLLTQDHLQMLFADAAMPVIELDTAAPVWQEQSESNLDINSIGLTSHHLAYVIYTSGSTGNPKGVMVSHLAVTNFLCSMRQSLSLGPQDVWLAVTTLSFDIAGLELYLPLFSGSMLTNIESTRKYGWRSFARRTPAWHHCDASHASNVASAFRSRLGKIKQPQSSLRWREAER